MTVPEPAVYTIQKILTNPERELHEKKAKDINAVKELLYHIKQSEYHFEKLKEVYRKLTQKQIKTITQVCVENDIELF